MISKSYLLPLFTILAVTEAAITARFSPFSNPLNDAAKDVTHSIWSDEIEFLGLTYDTKTYERIGFVWSGQIVGTTVATVVLKPPVPQAGTTIGGIMSGIIWDNFRELVDENSQYYRLEQIYLLHPVRNNFSLPSVEWTRYVNDFIKQARADASAFNVGDLAKDELVKGLTGVSEGMGYQLPGEMIELVADVMLMSVGQ